MTSPPEPGLPALSPKTAFVGGGFWPLCGRRDLSSPKGWNPRPPQWKAQGSQPLDCQASPKTALSTRPPLQLKDGRSLTRQNSHRGTRSRLRLRAKCEPPAVTTLPQGFPEKSNHQEEEAQRKRGHLCWLIDQLWLFGAGETDVSRAGQRLGQELAACP